MYTLYIKHCDKHKCAFWRTKKKNRFIWKLVQFDNNYIINKIRLFRSGTGNRLFAYISYFISDIPLSYYTSIRFIPIYWINCVCACFFSIRLVLIFIMACSFKLLSASIYSVAWVRGRELVRNVKIKKESKRNERDPVQSSIMF